jgi:cell division protein FtsW (lipid II flippase)/pSer/pThr/pTyr-binding forkhead associated (FHA) protein
MTVFEIAYLFRYLLLVLVILVIWLIVRQSLLQLRWSVRHALTPVKHFSLRRIDTFSGIMTVMPEVKPLYHTTILGRAASCDIRVERKTVGKKHAIIYLYDDDWFLRPVSGRRPVAINGVPIVPATPLEHLDRISLADQDFIFVDETLARKGYLYVPPDALPQQMTATVVRSQPDPDMAELGEEPQSVTRYATVPAMTLAIQPASLQFHDTGPFQRDAIKKSERSFTGSLSLAWLAVNLFAAAGCLLLYWMIPDSMDSLRPLAFYFFAGLLFLANFFYLLLPVIIRRADRIILLCMTFLIFLGLMVQVRLSLADADGQLANLVSDLSPQLISILLGLGLLPLIAVLTARTRILEILTVLCVPLTPLLLILTLILGRGADSHGATLWISIGGFSMQLTEFAKITYLIVLASIFKNRPARHTQFLFAIWAGAVFFLILLLPDLGSAMILLPVSLVVYVVMTSEYLTTLLITLGISGMGVVMYSVFPHVRRRIEGWTSLWTEVNDNNRQIIYSLQAIGRGGLAGRGLGNGSPGGIPLASSDMVFAIVCEELGLLAGLGLVLIFIVIFLRAARIALHARDGFTSSLALGAGSLFFVQAAVVIAGVTGLIPLTGATLPLIASGGSSVLMILILFAILIGLSARQVVADP